MPYMATGSITQPGPKVFLSYAHSDKALAQRVAATLQSEGIDVWMDDARVAPGDRITTSVIDAMDDADAIVLIVPQTRERYPWTTVEAALAASRAWQDRSVRVVPVVT